MLISHAFLISPSIIWYRSMKYTDVCFSIHNFACYGWRITSLGHIRRSLREKKSFNQCFICSCIIFYSCSCYADIRNIYDCTVSLIRKGNQKFVTLNINIFLRNYILIAIAAQTLSISNKILDPYQPTLHRNNNKNNSKTSIL